MRAHRDEIVIRSCGTKSARMIKVVDSGGSSIVFSISAAPCGDSRWNSSRMSTLRAPSVGASDDTRTTSLACSAEIDAPTRCTSRTSGCSPAMMSRASRWSRVSPPDMSDAANARAASSLVDPDGPTNRYACTGPRATAARRCPMACFCPTTSSQTSPGSPRSSGVRWSLSTDTSALAAAAVSSAAMAASSCSSVNSSSLMSLTVRPVPPGP